MSEQEQIHILDQIEAYLSDGLSPGERLELESHAAACETCAQALAEARAAHEEFDHLFAEVRPPASFEDDVIRRLRKAPASRRAWNPVVVRSALAAAAVVALTGTGIVVNQAIQGEPLANLFANTSRVKVESNLRQIGHAMAMYGSQETQIGREFPRVYATAGDSPSRELGLKQWGELPPAAKDGIGAGGVAPAGAGTVAFSSSGASSSAGDPALSGVNTYRGGTTITPTDGRLGRSLTETAAANAFYFKPSEQLTLAASPGDKPADQSGIVTTPALTTPLVVNGGTVALGTAAPASAAARPENFGALAAPLAQAAPAQQQGQAPAAEPQAQATAPAIPPPPVESHAGSGRKIIRNGSMEFEIERFDDTVVRVTKLVTELGGFIATTDSDKLPNGKMKGTVTLRVPPERLDTLVLELRGVGELKSQKIGAEDVTKQYTDLESQLRAAQTMYDRLLDIIKTGKGEVKDLVAAEKELGVWEQKIEQLKGEQKYLDNLVSFSTLVLQLYEKDIRTPASVSETEQVSMSLETDKVDDDYNKAIEAIRSAKGHILQSELKQYDAGQFGATIQAAIPPDAAEQTIARLRQLDGRIAHFSRDHRQTPSNGVVALSGSARVEREDVVVALQIYNLANIAPRRTMALTLAATAVDKIYQQVIEQARSAGGRIVTSSLTKPDPHSQVADLDVQVPSDKADAVLDAVRVHGEVMRQDLTENPDTQNVTEAKRGFRLHIVSLSAVPARETQTLQLAAANVPQAFADILNAVKSADARVIQSDLNQRDPQDVTGTLSFEVSREAASGITVAIDKSSQLLTRAVNRSADVENTVDSKLRISLTLVPADRLPPRESATVRVEVGDVERAADDLVNAATSAGGRRIGNGQIDQERSGTTTAQVVVDVPLDKAGAILDQLDRTGHRRSKQVSFDTTVPDGRLARARIDATFSNSPASLGGEETTWDAIHHGLSVSGSGLRWSLQMLVVGFCFVAPWVVVLWILWRIIRRSRKTPAQPTTAATA